MDGDGVEALGVPPHLRSSTRFHGRRLVTEEELLYFISLRKNATPTVLFYYLCGAFAENATIKKE